MLRIDHVVLAVADLDRAAEALASRGLATESGGTHPRWGTGNRIAPLGDTYVELLGVVDHAVARSTMLGRAISERASGGDRWFALCLADDDLTGTAERLGLTIEAGSRTRPDGSEVRWRGAGIEDPRRTRDLPFFIAWETPDTHPGTTPVSHPSGASAIRSVEIAGDDRRFAAWTGGADLPVRIVGGAPGVRAVVLETEGGELRIDGAPDRAG